MNKKLLRQENYRLPFILPSVGATFWAYDGEAEGASDGEADGDTVGASDGAAVVAMELRREQTQSYYIL